MCAWIAASASSFESNVPRFLSRKRARHRRPLICTQPVPLSRVRGRGSGSGNVSGSRLYRSIASSASSCVGNDPRYLFLYFASHRPLCVARTVPVLRAGGAFSGSRLYRSIASSASSRVSNIPRYFVLYTASQRSFCLARTVPGLRTGVEFAGSRVYSRSAVSASSNVENVPKCTLPCSRAIKEPL